jgi:hypothetical protein
VDEYRLNPVGTPPTRRFGRPVFSAVSVEEAGPGAERVHGDVAG